MTTFKRDGSSDPDSRPEDLMGGDDKPRLTEEEKKANHIASGKSRT
jgi:hypothetical protein